MIRITCGTCDTSQGCKTAADGILTLPSAEEKRFVLRGVAEYATRPIIGSGADSPVEGGDGEGAGINPPEENTALTGLEKGESGEDGEDSAAFQEGAVETGDDLDIVNGHLTRESLMQLTRADMEQLAADMGVDIRKCRNKGEIADLLVAVKVQAEDDGDGEDPPELGAEAPLV